MFNPGAYENTTPDGIAVLEVWDGDRQGERQPRQFVPLKRTELRGEVVGPLASLCLTQHYGFSREQCARVLETVYRCPLPGDAAVTAVRVRFGKVEIHTRLKERPEAEADYEAARREGRQAALLTRESPDVFTLRVAGIEPDQEVVVETSYVQRARAEGSGWSLRIPLTTAPRYVRGDETGSRPAQGQPLALLRDPGHRFALDLKLWGAASVTSPTHRLAAAEDDNFSRIRLQDGEVLPDRDCVLVWQPRQERDRPTFQVWRHDDPAADQVYFLALLAPPAVPDPGAGVPREVILLVDHSGSMQGAKWAAADWAVKQFLAGLAEGDTFNLGLFHNTTRWFAKSPRAADPETVAQAIRFLEEHRDSGGTELGVALEQALHQERLAGETARHVLILTDAEVTDSGRILRLADRESPRADRRRISLLCIDAAPNAYLAGELAERGGGVARFLTSDPEQEDITTALDEVLADWAQPVLAGLRLEVSRPGVQCVGREVTGDEDAEAGLIDLGDLPAGRPLWVVGRFPRAGASDVTLRVTAPPRREVKSRRLDLTDGSADRPAIKALFGAHRLLRLEQLIHAGYAGDELVARLQRLGYPLEALAAPAGDPKLYAENQRADSQAALNRLLVQESLSFGLPSSETAFVGMRSEPGKPVEETAVVANALPAGWSEEFLVMSAAARSPQIMAISASMPVGGADTILRGVTGMDASLSAAGMSPAMAASPSFARPANSRPAATRPLFSGVPTFVGGEALLFDTSRAEDAGRLPEAAALTALRLRFPQGAPDPAAVDPGLVLVIFIGDLAQPRARVRLAELIRQGGERPLNLTRRPGQPVRLLLLDPAGAWARGAPPIEVELALA